MIDKKLFDEVELQNAQSKALFQHKVQALNEEMAKFQALQQEYAALEESFRQPAPPPVDPMAEVDAYLNQAPQRTAEEPAPVVAPPQDTSEVEAPKATSTRHKAVNPGLYKSVIEGLASKYDIPSKLLMSVVHSESGFNPDATSSTGAIGLMQLMPGTARDLGVDPTDPMQNLEGGTRYLKQQLDRFGSVPLALAAYNAGPGAVKKYGGVPPFKETRDYVDKVMEGVGKYADGGLVGLYQKYEDGGEVKKNLRTDGTPKGTGWLGVMKAPTGKDVTELSIGVELGGKETLIPLVVPTLSQDEVQYLLDNSDSLDLQSEETDPIVRKAIDHAIMRQQTGKSPFADAPEYAAGGAVKGYGPGGEVSWQGLVDKYNQAADYVGDVSKKVGDYFSPPVDTHPAQIRELAPTDATTANRLDKPVDKDLMYLQNWYKEPHIGADVPERERKNMLSRIQKIGYGIPITYNESATDLASYTPLFDTINISPGDKEIMAQSKMHEGDHAAHRDTPITNVRDLKVYWENIKPSFDYATDPNRHPITDDAFSDHAYLSNVLEGHARLMTFRKYFNLKPEQKIKINDIENFKNRYKSGTNTDIDQLIDMAPNDQALVNMLNLMSKNDSRPDKQELINALTNKNYV